MILVYTFLEAGSFEEGWRTTHSWALELRARRR
jgi:hypothetical protein